MSPHQIISHRTSRDQVHTHTHHTNLDLANIVGRTGFDFENFAFFGLFGSQISRPGLGQAAAVKDSTYEERLKDGEGLNKWSRTQKAICRNQCIFQEN